jgi:hypothetical protein
MFSKNQEVYNEQGHCAKYVNEIEEGMFLVKPISIIGNGNDYEEIENSPTIWNRIFAKPPIQKQETTLVNLEKTIQEKRQELYKIEDSIRNYNRNSSELLARLKKHEQLTRIDDFLEGRVSHFVFIGYYDSLEIKTFEETVKEGSYSKHKLLCLYGDLTEGKKKLGWMLNRWSDGSGSNSYVVPFDSLEGAEEYCKNCIKNAFQLVLTKYPEQSEYTPSLLSLVTDADKFGVIVPENLRNRQNENSLNHYYKKLNENLKTLGDVQKNIEDLNEKIKETKGE